MGYHAEKQSRRSIRLPEYDYSLPGAYFVTICTRNRWCLFGEIVGSDMRLNRLGKIVQQCWDDIPHHMLHIRVDQFIVMPNHIHGLLWIDGSRGTACRAPTEKRRFGKPIKGSLSTVIGSFKSAVTKKINELRNTPGVSVWQRNYYERVIRDKNELNQIREYILFNPQNWNRDRENPNNHNNQT